MTSSAIPSSTWARAASAPCPFVPPVITRERASTSLPERPTKKPGSFPAILLSVLGKEILVESPLVGRHQLPQRRARHRGRSPTLQAQGFATHCLLPAASIPNREFARPAGPAASRSSRPPLQQRSARKSSSMSLTIRLERPRSAPRSPTAYRRSFPDLHLRGHARQSDSRHGRNPVPAGRARDRYPTSTTPAPPPPTRSALQPPAALPTSSTPPMSRRALDLARREAGAEGVVVVTGSIYIVGEAMRLLDARIE